MKSLIDQTYENMEILLIDDGSTDGSGALCDELSRQYSNAQAITVYHKENGGLSSARNYGLDRAKGEYILCVDSDDYVDVDLISTVLSTMRRQSADITFFYFEKFMDGSNEQVYNEELFPDIDSASPKKALELLFSKQLENYAWSFIARRNVYQNIRFPVGRNFEDKATTYRLIDNARRVAFVSQSLYHYRYRSTSITKRMRFADIESELTTFEEQSEWIARHYPELKQEQRKFYLNEFLIDYKESTSSAAMNYAQRAKAHALLSRQLTIIQHELDSSVLPRNVVFKLFLMRLHILPLIQVIKHLLSQ